METLTDFLFARPSFVEGMARTLDIGGTLQEYNGSSGGEEADTRAFEMDVRAIGNDFRKALETFAAKQGEGLEQA